MIKILPYLLFALSAISTISAKAQMSISYMLDKPSFTLLHQNTNKKNILDSCYLTISYDTRFRAFEKDDSLSHSNIMDLQMGRLFNAFFSKNLRDLDTKNTREMRKRMMIETIPENYLGWDIIIDNTDSVATTTNRIPYTSEVIEYSERIPVIQWKKIPEEADTIMGYPCKKAVGEFGGRIWEIMYAEDIPLPFGPWKLGGADGLILRAADTENNFIFEAAGLTQQSSPIIRYRWPRKQMDKEEWKIFERDIYRNAGAFVRSTGASVSIADDSEKGFHDLTEDWQEFYNPLER